MFHKPDSDICRGSALGRLQLASFGLICRYQLISVFAALKHEVNHTGNRESCSTALRKGAKIGNDSPYVKAHLT